MGVVPRPSALDPRLARVLRDLRLGGELSQEAVAHDAGLTVSAYARIERGEVNPTWSTVVGIARALGVSLAALGESVEKTS